MVYGSDLDIRVLKGYKVGYTKDSLKNKTKSGCNIFTNFKEYNLPMPNILRADINYFNFIRNNDSFSIKIFDCIICDPPYGIRAMTRQNTGQVEYRNNINEDNIKCNLIENTNNSNNCKFYDKEFEQLNSEFVSFSPLIKCEVNQLYLKLLETSYKLLKSKGKLVCLYPIIREDNIEV